MSAAFRSGMRVTAAAVLLAVVAGCHAGWSVLSDPERDRVLRVTSGDTILFRLDEDGAAGYRWDYTCDDRDVSVVVEHDDAATPGVMGVAKVTVHVHRGYDGPSTVHFTYKRRTDPKPTRQFTQTLYRRTGDVAFWE